MPSFRPFWLLMLCALAMSGCSPAGDGVPTAPFVGPGVVFELRALPQESGCDAGKPFVVEARWEVRDVNDPKFDLTLDTSEGTLWARSNHAEGSERTDAWAVPGQWFLLVERRSRVVLAAQQAPSLVCG